MLQDIPFNAIVDVINPRIVEEGGEKMSYNVWVIGTVGFLGIGLGVMVSIMRRILSEIEILVLKKAVEELMSAGYFTSAKYLSSKNGMEVWNE